MLNFHLNTKLKQVFGTTFAQIYFDFNLTSCLILGTFWNIFVFKRAKYSTDLLHTIFPLCLQSDHSVQTDKVINILMTATNQQFAKPRKTERKTEKRKEHIRMIIKAKRKCDHKNTIIRKKEREKGQRTPTRPIFLIDERRVRITYQLALNKQ